MANLRDIPVIISNWSRIQPLPDWLYWYDEQSDMLSGMAEETGFTQNQLAYAAAALSPNNSWSSNLRDLHTLVYQIDRPITAYGMQVALAEHILGYNPQWTLELTGVGPKVWCFGCNLAGDLSKVTVDRHMIALGLGKEGRSGDLTITIAAYRALYAIGQQLASLWGVAPAQWQSSLWGYKQT